MKRRSFLQRLGAGLAALGLVKCSPVPVLAEVPVVPMPSKGIKLLSDGPMDCPRCGNVFKSRKVERFGSSGLPSGLLIIELSCNCWEGRQ